MQRRRDSLAPLIGSIEGLANTPAYRGLALAVFENLELVEFGNRIPFLTFEVVADEEPVALSEVAADASRGLIQCETDDFILGYAAYGSSIRSAVEPLTRAYALRLFDDGARIRSAQSEGPVTLSNDELGATPGQEAKPRLEREQDRAAAPAALRLSYYDSQRDFQSGEARASASEESGSEERLELAAVLTADDAKSLVQHIIARRWAEDSRITLRLPPSRLGIEPGTTVVGPFAAGQWIIDQCTIDAFAVIAELIPLTGSRSNLIGTAGRVMANVQAPASELKMAMIEVPEELRSPGDSGLALAASSPTRGWRRHYVEVSCGGRTELMRTAGRKAVLGRSVSELGEDGVEIELHDPDQWLVSCTDEDLAHGDNVAILGNEVIRFGDALCIGAGRFRLSRLMRGIETKHAEGEHFVVIDRSALQPISLPAGTSADDVRVSASADKTSCEVIRVAAERPKARATSAKRSAARGDPSRRRRAGR